MTAAASSRPLVAGNWKMNGLGAHLTEIDALVAALGRGAGAGCDVMICPPATLISRMAERAAGTRLVIGAQDCHALSAGAHTGDLAAEMLREAGAGAVIVGHSERRADHGEGDDAVRAKATAAHRAGLRAIICVGESEAERRSSATLDVIGRQLAGSLPETVGSQPSVIAYEPVWAIGTGLTPTEGDVEVVHRFIRERLAARFGAAGGAVPILYGGSVKPSNARALMAVPEVGGALVGGASLKAADFLGIIEAYA